MYQTSLNSTYIKILNAGNSRVDFESAKINIVKEDLVKRIKMAGYPEIAEYVKKGFSTHSAHIISFLENVGVISHKKIREKSTENEEDNKNKKKDEEDELSELLFKKYSRDWQKLDKDFLYQSTYGIRYRLNHLCKLYANMLRITKEECQSVTSYCEEKVDSLIVDGEQRMDRVIDPEKKLFLKNGDTVLVNSADFDWSGNAECFDFAIKHNMAIHGHAIVSGLAYPQQLKSELDKLTESIVSPEKKKEVQRKLCLKFIKTYFKKYLDLHKKESARGLTLDCVDFLHEITDSTDTLEIADGEISNTLKDCVYKEILGDEYYIDVLLVAKEVLQEKDMSEVKLVWKEDGEYTKSADGTLVKFEKMKQILTTIHDYELENGVQLLDIVSLESHLIGKETKADMTEVISTLSQMLHNHDDVFRAKYPTSTCFQRLEIGELDCIIEDDIKIQLVNEDGKVSEKQYSECTPEEQEQFKKGKMNDLLDVAYEAYEEHEASVDAGQPYCGPWNISSLTHWRSQQGTTVFDNEGHIDETLNNSFSHASDKVNVQQHSLQPPASDSNNTGDNDK